MLCGISRRIRRGGSGTGRILRENLCVRCARTEYQVRSRLGVWGSAVLRPYLKAAPSKSTIRRMAVCAVRPLGSR